jgi:hypothetical protein
VVRFCKITVLICVFNVKENAFLVIRDLVCMYLFSDTNSII